MTKTPANPQRTKPKRLRAGNMSSLKRRLWNAILRAEHVLETAGSPEMTLKACHCLGQLAGQYRQIIEGADLEARIAELERQATEGHL